MPDTSTASLVREASAGDQRAWNELVDRYTGMVWAIARAHQLSPTDAADVCQTVWLRLVEHLDRLRDPSLVAGWLATTTRHECLRVLKLAGRELPEEELSLDQRSREVESSPESVVLHNESRALLRKALERLSLRCQMLLKALAMAPKPNYAEVSSALGIPVGSIGPTRQRCLDYLRRELAAQQALP
ncbi:hypothetical protein TH66_07725 [Carbonactinospora thermoautotrophica]|uniref:RNA polymerase sigma-70 region 2 domain-containing protein n=1 Tax=Carbonactinospora thermoautotrophica TaxID=1469144 RepID=A0A132NHE4_9ACTN|nr:hypothetical protein TH66_07725 [Carbonactinospora thermoautotrophica]KWX09551.1 hypothetical protein TR74_08905 [Carbonactinospora thermoautotrophica]